MNRWSAATALVAVLLAVVLPGCPEEEQVDARQALVDLAMEARGEALTLLDENNPHIRIEGKHARSDRTATLPLRPDLADDLQKHVARLAEANGVEVTPNTPLFNVGRNFLRTFNLDLAAAGIAKRDAQDRTVDVHSRRHTFATLALEAGRSIRWVAYSRSTPRRSACSDTNRAT